MLEFEKVTIYNSFQFSKSKEPLTPPQIKAVTTPKRTPAGVGGGGAVEGRGTAPKTTMDSLTTPYIVQADYSFKGSNNDELCFKKGDIITVTQREEGGWWEGTLDEKTGWFPSNYVKEHKTTLPVMEMIRPPEEIQASRLLVLNDLVESEKAHVAEIRGLLENFLEPLETSQM